MRLLKLYESYTSLRWSATSALLWSACQYSSRVCFVARRLRLSYRYIIVVFPAGKTPSRSSMLKIGKPKLRTPTRYTCSRGFLLSCFIRHRHHSKQSQITYRRRFIVHSYYDVFLYMVNLAFVLHTVPCHPTSIALLNSGLVCDT